MASTLRTTSRPTTRRSLLSWLLPTPDQVVRSYLTTDEVPVLIDQPSTQAFLVQVSTQIVLILGALLVIGVWVTQGGNTTIAAVLFIAVDILAIYVIIERLQFWYTRYVLTDFRVMRSWGVFHRQMAWIPWSKVTDVTIDQSALGRVFGYATVKIESANEASGLKAMKDLREPHRFHRVIAEMVEAKQGKTVPYWMQRVGSPLPEVDDDIMND
jgi:membrane protein YdbS with pleckstrin-like domain